MKKFLIVFIIVLALTFAVPFISLVDSDKGNKESSTQDEIVTIFSGEKG